ncbi:MAG: AI-2E family transporter, partial [Phycisphaerales bacterium]|nr:AI-2E family transporter [Phycisphaerales bacterium]
KKATKKKAKAARKQESAPASSAPAAAAAPEPPESDWKAMHLWQIQPIRDVLLVVLILLVVYLGKVLSIVTVPILVAMLLAYLFEPVVRLLLSRFHRMTRTQAVSIILATGIIIPVSILAIGLGLAVIQGVGIIRGITDNMTLVTGYVKDQHAFEDEGLSDDMSALYEVSGKDAEEDAATATRLQKVLEEAGYYDDYLWRVSAYEEARAEAEAQPGSETEATGKTEPKDEQPAAEPSLSPENLLKEQAPKAEIPEAPDFTWEPGMSDAYRELPTDGWRQVAAWAGKLRTEEIGFLGDANTSVGEFIRSEQIRQMGERSMTVVSRGWDAFATIIKAVVSVFAFGFMIFLTCFFYFFIATSYPAVTRFGDKLLPDKHRPRILDLLSQMDRVVAGFVRGRLTICVIQSVFFAIGYWIIGTPGALVLGVVIGILSIVPYLALVGIPTAILLMFLDPPGDALRSNWLWILLAPAAIYFLGQAIDDYILTPRIQGKTTNMDTPTILFASLAGGTLLGVYGLLLAIPLAACLKILLRELFWPRFKAWTEGEEKDFLPISRN